MTSATAARTDTDAVGRWRALVRARREQMEAQLAALGGPPDDWWSARGGVLARGIGEPAATPPWGLTQIAERLERTDTLIDVGAGAGRYAVPLSRVLGHVTLIEPSPAMAERARSQFAAAERSNFDLLESGWMEAEVEPSTAVLLANVLNPQEEVDEWLGRAVDHAKEWLFLVHGTPPDTAPPLQQVAVAFHGEERVRQPSFADLLPVLYELGMRPEVKIGERSFARHYATATDAARELAQLATVSATTEHLRQIRSIIRSSLRRLPDGRVALPDVTSPVAFIAWRIHR